MVAQCPFSMNRFPKFKEWLTRVSSLTDNDYELFESSLHVKAIKRKEFFLKEGVVCKEMGFINEGAFRTFFISGDKEINTRFVFENQFAVDYNSFLQEKPSRYFIQALEDSELIMFNFATLKNAYQLSKNWERFGRIMAEEACNATTQRVESFLFYDGEKRYRSLLNDDPQLFNRVPLYHIASYLGLERESLSRLRKKVAAV